MAAQSDAVADVHAKVTAMVGELQAWIAANPQVDTFGVGLVVADGQKVAQALGELLGANVTEPAAVVALASLESAPEPSESD